MTERDDDTLAFYRQHAAAYAARGQPASASELQRFLALLPPRAKILELGCGAGQDSEAMILHGFEVTPTDGTPELAARAAQRLGIPVDVLLFENLDAVRAYQGVWASACLLHLPRAALAGVLDRIFAALTPGGVFYASFKAGAEEGRDGLGRFYNYPSAEWLRAACKPSRWQQIDLWTTAGGGFDNVATDWLHLIAVKSK
jgi:SAM-dependent methyltransferase